MFFPQLFLHSLGKVLFRLIFGKYFFWVVVSNYFHVHPYLGKMSNLTYIFSKGLKPPARFGFAAHFFWGNACNACNEQDGNQANHKVNRVRFSLVVCLLFLSDAPLYLFLKKYI